MFRDYDGNIYECRAYQNILVVQVTRPDGSFTKKTVRIVPDTEFIYKLQQTQIRAIDGAEGLKKYLDKNSFDCFTSKVYKWIIDSMKEV